MKAMHCFVTGRVQGVFFRESSVREARSLGLKGWVRNLRDGRVELYAMGEDVALEQMRAWLEQGPPLAEVDLLECQETLEIQEGLNDFRVMR